MEIVRLANGKVVERWSNFDQLGFYRQLGVTELQDVV
jgi:predicted ester cyclase